MRVATSARGLAGPKAKRTTSRCGLRSLKTMISVTRSVALIGLSTVTRIGTALPFSTSGAMSSVTRPVCTGWSPAQRLITSCSV